MGSYVDLCPLQADEVNQLLRSSVGSSGAILSQREGQCHWQLPLDLFTPDLQTVSLPHSLPQSSFLSKFQTLAAVTLCLGPCNGLILKLRGIPPRVPLFPIYCQPSNQNNSFEIKVVACLSIVQSSSRKDNFSESYKAL